MSRWLRIAVKVRFRPIRVLTTFALAAVAVLAVPSAAHATGINCELNKNFQAGYTHSACPNYPNQWHRVRAECYKTGSSIHVFYGARQLGGTPSRVWCGVNVYGVNAYPYDILWNSSIVLG
jgi:hypothetical protein